MRWKCAWFWHFHGEHSQFLCVSKIYTINWTPCEGSGLCKFIHSLCDGFFLASSSKNLSSCLNITTDRPLAYWEFAPIRKNTQRAFTGNLERDRETFVCAEALVHCLFSLSLSFCAWCLWGLGVEQEAFHALFVPLSPYLHSHGIRHKKQTADEMVKVTLAALPACLPGIKVSAFASLARTNFHNTFYIILCCWLLMVEFHLAGSKTRRKHSPRQRFFFHSFVSVRAGGNNLPRHHLFVRQWALFECVGV